MQKKFPQDAKTSLSNQLLQRFISCLCLQNPDQSILQFGSNQYGKPHLVGSQFSFSMSNQQGYTSMVVSLKGNQVGIDLASCSDVDQFDNDYIPNFKDIFHRDEYEVLERVKEDDKRLLFTEYWALKESYTKKLGVGLNGDLTSYNFQNVPLLDSSLEDYHNTKAIRSSQKNTIFEIKPVKWKSETNLSINSKLEDLDIHLALINPNLVVSVCGEIQEEPLLVKVPLRSIVQFLS